MNLLTECIEIVRGIAGNDYLYFDSAVEVKVNPHTPAFHAWGVCVSPKNDLYVMDGNEQWHQLKTSDQHAHLVIGSLYQRLNLLRVRYAKAS